jgi:hypothetical protein
VRIDDEPNRLTRYASERCDILRCRLTSELRIHDDDMIVVDDEQGIRVDCKRQRLGTRGRINAIPERRHDDVAEREWLIRVTSGCGRARRTRCEQESGEGNESSHGPESARLVRAVLERCCVGAL